MIRLFLLGVGLCFVTGCGCGSTPPKPLTCPTGQTACDNECALLAQSDRHCGACGTACPDAQACAAGACAPKDCPDTDCSESQVCPNGRCVDKSCVGVMCPAGQACLSGACVDQSCGGLTCAAGYVCLNGACADSACFGVLCPTGKVCVLGLCQSGSCDDNVQSPGETDVDCGGVCARKCEEGRGCAMNGDCASANCVAQRCAMPTTCTDGLHDGDETGVDCGGSCPTKCPGGQPCTVPGDCASGQCVMNVCSQPSTCGDAMADGRETDVDCGGPDCMQRCGVGKKCMTGGDCASSSCVMGTCAAPSCTDAVANGDETDVDCGGSCTTKCLGACKVDGDCVNKVCTMMRCAQPTCTDLQQNGDETDVDCGGSCARKCGMNAGCAVPADCASGVCTSHQCVGEPSCVDGMKNQDEVDTDCGGVHCAPCADGKHCLVPGDCIDAFCNASKVCTRGFPARDTYTPVTTWSAFVGCGRFNADAYADLVLAGSQMAFMIATPAGAFSPPQQIPGVTIVAGSTDLQVLDLDKDGNLDVLSPYYDNSGNGNTRFLVVRGNGNGTFGAPLISNFTPMNYPKTGHFGVGDMNGDGLLDAVVPYESVLGTPVSGPALMLGNGFGNFANAAATGVSTPADAPLATGVADFDGDGAPDVVALLASGKLYALANRDGGTLVAQPTTYALGSGGIQELKIAQLAHDGGHDVVSANAGPAPQLSVLHHRGGFAFTQTGFALNGSVYGLAVADLNVDSNLDVAVANGNTISLFMGDGRGNFNAGPSVTLAGSGNIAVCDFNGDGRPDIAQVTSTAVYVFLNQ